MQPEEHVQKAEEYLRKADKAIEHVQYVEIHELVALCEAHLKMAEWKDVRS